MDARLHILTLGVADLERARRFYETGLGWPLHPKSNPQVLFFRLPGLILGLYDRSALAEDAGFADPGLRDPNAFGGSAMAQNLPSEQAVRDAMATAIAAGGRELVAPEKVFWGGFRGYVADPDGHAWELAYNPGWDFDDAGALA